MKHTYIYKQRRRYVLRNTFTARGVFARLLLCVLLLQPIGPLFAAEQVSESSTTLESAALETVVQNEAAQADLHEGGATQQDIVEAPTETSSDEVLAEDSEDMDVSPALSATDPEDDGAQTDVSDPLNVEDLTSDTSSSTSITEHLADDASTEDQEISSPDVAVDAEAGEVLGVETGSTTIGTTTTTSVSNTPTTSEPIVPSPVPASEVVADEELSQPTIEDEIDSLVDEGGAPSITNVVVQDIDVSMAAIDDNHYLFSKDACIAMGDGTFYCQRVEEKPVVLDTDRVFAAPDSDGDKEIFVEREGELTQISYNLFEDDAPYFDELSNTIVWHRLIDGRYQIIAYSIEDDQETQLTHDHYNNMEPSRFDDVTVWQGWVGNDWEVMMAEEDVVTMLTDNTDPDIVPRITGDYIMWQSFEGNAWRVKVYDRRTGEIETIADANGASLDNPRFVLVYDTKHENGDVETKGYDLRSGQVVPLSATPAPTPKDLPDPEQTGEDRAFVQTPVSVKTKSVTGDANGEGEPDTDTDQDTSTTSPAFDVIVTPYIDDSLSTSTSTSTDDVVSPVVTEATTPSTTPHISDLIITPFVEEIEPTHSQGEVASST